MVRKLKYHEEKLLKKVDFMNWPVDNNLHEAKVMQKFHIRKREDYTKWVVYHLIASHLDRISNGYLFCLVWFWNSALHRYNKLSRTIRELAKRISEIDAKEPFRTEMSAALLEKLYVLGLIPTKWDLNNAVNISASSFCRRRLPVVMVRSEYILQLTFRCVQSKGVSVDVDDAGFLFVFISQITCHNTSKMPQI